MVLLDSKFRSKYRKLVRQARTEKIRVVRLESNLWYVARREAGHGRYFVQLDTTKSGTFATCRNIRGASCPTFGCCTHVCAVYERLVREKKTKLERQLEQSIDMVRQAKAGAA